MKYLLIATLLLTGCVDRFDIMQLDMRIDVLENKVKGLEVGEK